MLGVMAAPSASSAVITPINGSFEAPDVAGSSTATVPDWATFGFPDRSRIQDGPVMANIDGDQFLVLDDRVTVGEVGVFQGLGAIEADHVYTLEIKVGRRSDLDAPGQFTFGLYTGVSNGGFTPGNAVVAESNATDVSGDTLLEVIDNNAGTLIDRTLTFDTTNGNNAALVGQNLFVRMAITGGSGPGNADQLVFDAVTVTVVPEPGSLTLSGLGADALLDRRCGSM
jgi:hypothetical protein